MHHKTLIMTFLYVVLPFASSVLAEDLPIADVHMHAYERTSTEADWYASQMDKLGVKWAGGVGNYSEEMVSKLGDRYIAAYGQSQFMAAFRNGGEEALKDSNNKFIKSMLTKSVELFEAKKIRGFGEIHTDNHTSGPAPIRRQISLDSPVILEIYKIANKYEGFVQLHVEYSESLAEQVIMLSQNFPRTKTILAHCVPGKSHDVLPQLHKIFSHTQNVFCETSGENGPTHVSMVPRKVQIYGEGNGRMFGKTGINKGWRKLIERFPDRVMVGTDTCCELKPKYPELVEEIRRDLLSQFTPAIARQLAFENAVKILKLQ